MTGQIFFGPPGAELADMEPLGYLAEGFSLLGDAAAETGEALQTFSAGFESFALVIDEVQWTPEIHRLILRWAKPKRWRKEFDRSHRQIKKQARAKFRAAQRRAIGIKENP